MNKLHAGSTNFVLFAIVLENYRAVALVAVDDKQPVGASRGRHQRRCFLTMFGRCSVAVREHQHCRRCQALNSRRALA